MIIKCLLAPCLAYNKQGELSSKPIPVEGTFLSILACLTFKELVLMLTSCSVAVPDIHTPPTAFISFLAIYSWASFTTVSISNLFTLYHNYSFGFIFVNTDADMVSDM